MCLGQRERQTYRETKREEEREGELECRRKFNPNYFMQIVYIELRTERSRC